MSGEQHPERNKLPFELFDYSDTSIAREIDVLINEGKLPFDTFFRLASVGCNQPDPAIETDTPVALRWNIMHDMVRLVENHESMRSETRELLWGKRPNAIIDWWSSSNHASYTQLDPMYYRMANLAGVIKRRRKAQGEALTEVPDGWWLTPAEQENRYCYGLARPIWQVIVRRIHPEWLKYPSEYYVPVISFNTVYYAAEPTMRRRIIGHTVISDNVVFDIYNEAIKTGVKGIGPSGKESLRTLLAEEHPELF